MRQPILLFTVIASTSTSAVLAAVQPWGQCGGQNWQGETGCTEGHTCVEQNAYYSQCLQSTGSDSTPGSSNASSTSTVAPIASSTPIASGNASASIASPTTLITRIATPTTTADADVGAGNGTTGGTGANGADCSIDTKFKSHAGKKYIGVATDQGRLSVTENAQIIIDNFGQVTPENRYILSPLHSLPLPLSPSDILCLSDADSSPV